MAQKFMVLVDGSEASTQALNKALSLKKADDELHLVHAVELLRPIIASHVYISQEKNNEALLETAKNLLKNYMNNLTESKVSNVSSSVLATKGSDPKEAACQYAEDKKIDVIFVGTRGLGRVKTFLLGSFSNHILHHARCSVMIVR